MNVKTSVIETLVNLEDLLVWFGLRKHLHTQAICVRLNCYSCLKEIIIAIDHMDFIQFSKVCRLRDDRYSASPNMWGERQQMRHCVWEVLLSNECFDVFLLQADTYIQQGKAHRCLWEHKPWVFSKLLCCLSCLLMPQRRLLFALLSIINTFYMHVFFWNG